MFDLENRRALVTGASGGIGGAVATALHGQGATVALAGRNRGTLEERAVALGDRAHVLTADLADPEAAEGLAKAATEAMGGSTYWSTMPGLRATTCSCGSGTKTGKPYSTSISPRDSGWPAPSFAA